MECDGRQGDGEVGHIDAQFVPLQCWYENETHEHTLKLTSIYHFQMDADSLQYEIQYSSIMKSLWQIQSSQMSTTAISKKYWPLSAAAEEAVHTTLWRCWTPHWTVSGLGCGRRAWFLAEPVDKMQVHFYIWTLLLNQELSRHISPLACRIISIYSYHKHLKFIIIRKYTKQIWFPSNYFVGIILRLGGAGGLREGEREVS